MKTSTRCTLVAALAALACAPGGAGPGSSSDAGGSSGGADGGGGGGSSGAPAVTLTQGSSNADVSAWQYQEPCAGMYTGQTSITCADNHPGLQRQIAVVLEGKPVDGQTVTFGPVQPPRVDYQQTPVQGQGSGVWSSTGGTGTLHVSGSHVTFTLSGVAMAPNPNTYVSARAAGTLTIDLTGGEADVLGL